MRLLLLAVLGVVSGVTGYSHTPKQYHIQTDVGPDRYFRFQTYNGQFRKEKRLEDGTVIGTYGWVDATGLLRLYDYIADTKGYRIVRQKTMKVPKITEPPPVIPVTQSPSISHATEEPSISQLIEATRRSEVLAQSDLQPGRVSSSSVPGSQPTRRKPLNRKKNAHLQGLSIYGTNRPYVSATRRPHVSAGSRTRNRGSTRWGRRPVASQTLGTMVTRTPRPQLLRPHSQSTTVKSGVSPEPKSPSQSQRIKDVTRDPAEIDDLPSEGKVTLSYDLGNQFHVEKILPDGTKVGKHGYVDPLGILRVTHYTSGPTGHTSRQESRWVGTRHPYNP